MTTGAQLDPDRDLDVAMAVAAEVNRVIATADAKTGLVLAAQGVVLAGVASSMRSGPVPLMSLRIGAVVVLAVAVIVVLLLLASLWPRTGDPEPRWFAFTALRHDNDGTVPPRPDTERLATQAWMQTATLADIARRKFQWFRAALVVGTVELVGFVIWVALVVAS